MEYYGYVSVKNVLKKLVLRMGVGWQRIQIIFLMQFLIEGIFNKLNKTGGIFRCPFRDSVQTIFY